MSQPFPVRPRSPVSLNDRARDNIRFIRETMERAGSFTAVPGWGGIALGITALGAATIASRMSRPRDWLLIWLSELAVAIGIAGWTALLEGGRSGSGLLSGQARGSRTVLPDARGRFAHRCSVPPRRDGSNPWNVAASLRNRGCHGGRVFDPRGSIDGALFRRARRGGAFLPLELGQRIFGCGFWRAAHTFWRGNCEELWRLN